MNGQRLAAWNLRKWRVARDLSQEKLAVDAGVDRAHVSRLERGIDNVTVQVLDRLAAALEIHISEFFRIPERGEARPKPLPRGRRKAPLRRR